MAVSQGGTGAATESAELELFITRVFDAPRKLVFKAWTEAEHLERWQGAPRGFTVTSHDVDMRPGGAYRICMRSPEGVDHWLQGVYREVVEPERLVFTAVARDKQGNPLLESLTTVAFVKNGGRTQLTVEASAVGLAPGAPQMLDGMEAGWTQSLERLANHVSRIG